MSEDEKESLLVGLEVVSFALNDNMQEEAEILEACIQGIKDGDFSKLDKLLAEEVDFDEED